MRGVLLCLVVSLPHAEAKSSCGLAEGLPEFGDAELGEDSELSVQMLQQSLVLARARVASDRAPRLPSPHPAQHGAGAGAGPAEASSSEQRASAAVGGGSGPAPTARGAHGSRAAGGAPAGWEASSAPGERHGRRPDARPGAELLQARPARGAPNHFFTLYTTCVKYALLAILILLVLTMACFSSRLQDTRPTVDGEEVVRLEMTCGGLCPCRLHPEPKESDLESWEKGGHEVFGQCPAWLHLPRDLGPRQWTWRVAEINLWIQVLISANLVYESYEAPRAVLKSLQLSLAVMMMLASISAASWVHMRSRNILIHYFFFTLVTKAFYISAKYAVLSSFVTACALAQSSFSGCTPVGELAGCITESHCMQEVIERTSCKAPGADTCASLQSYMPAGQDIFVYDALELFFFLMGTVPVFMAATARESVTGAAKPLSQ